MYLQVTTLAEISMATVKLAATASGSSGGSNSMSEQHKEKAAVSWGSGCGKAGS